MPEYTEHPIADRCRFDGCSAERWKRGFCSRHYTYARRHGIIPLPPCSMVGCSRPVHGKGLCSVHHHRLLRHGDANTQLKAGNGTAKLIPCRECGEPSASRGICRFHFAYARRNGLVTKRPCAVSGCDLYAYEGHDHCNTHRQRLLRYGDVNFRKKLANGEQTLERKREVYRGIWRRYRAKPHGKLRSAYHGATRRLRKGKSGKITKPELLALWATSTCSLCGLPVKDEEKTIDHIIPLSRGGTNECSNLQIAHSSCNKRKGNRLHGEAKGTRTHTPA